MNIETETLIFCHWSEKVVSPVDAVKQIETRLIRSFNDCKIDKADQKFEICGAELTDVDNNEIKVKVKVPKDFGKTKKLQK